MAAHPQLNSSTLFDQLDFDKRGSISYNEFLAASLGGTERLASLDEEAVRRVFTMLDTDSSGFVTRHNVLSALGGVCTEEEVDEMFVQLGCTSGKLFFVDLLRLMTYDGGPRVAGIAPSSRSRPGSLSGPRRSTTMSNLTLQSEATAANANPLRLRTVLVRARTMQNVSKVLSPSTGRIKAKSVSTRYQSSHDINLNNDCI
jgi:hypothetical protein